ncbi:MAG: FAD:protein FMN transferase, partial [Bacteroidota bacterium]
MVGRGRTPATVVRFLKMAVAPFLVLLVFLAASRFADVEGLSLAEGAKPDTSGRSEPAFSEIRFLMDTVVRIQVWGDKTASGRAGTAAYRAMQEVAAFADRFNPDSEVSRINQAAGKRAVPVSAGLFDLLDRTLQVSRMSEGALDPTIGPLVDLWGFSRENPRVPAPEDVAAARHLVRYQELILDRTRRTAYLCRPGMVLDLGATAKGYAVDAAGKVLRGYLRAGAISAALIDAGGDILVIGSRPGGGRWRIGVRNPRGSGAVGIINLAAGAAVTSGDYERFFVENGVRYSHLLD